MRIFAYNCATNGGTEVEESSSGDSVNVECGRGAKGGSSLTPL